nr:hypothetical protein CFP56_19536 [Quercus suber]
MAAVVLLCSWRLGKGEDIQRRHLADGLILLRLHRPRRLQADGVGDELHEVRADALEMFEEAAVGTLDLPAAVEVEVQLLEAAVLAEVAQRGHEDVVVDEAPLLVRHRIGVETGGRVVELKADVAEEPEVDGADRLDEGVHATESQLSPIVLPEGAKARGASAEVEFVLAVQNRSAFAVDLLAGSQQSCTSREAFGCAKVDGLVFDEGHPVDLVTKFRRLDSVSEGLKSNIKSQWRREGDFYRFGLDARIIQEVHRLTRSRKPGHEPDMTGREHDSEVGDIDLSGSCQCTAILPVGVI